MPRRLIALIAALVLLLTACSHDDGTGKSFRYDIYTMPDNLDPQLARSAEALMVVEHCFEGLLRQSGSGELLPGVAERYTVSDDAMTYTFYLREDACWYGADDPIPVTADDFVFAFQRLLDPTTNAPSATNFDCIEGAREALAGTLDPTQVDGVTATDDHTLVIQLCEPDPFFPALCASAAAMPCNRTFFTETRGRYGLGPDQLLYNGPFYIQLYSQQEYIRLRQSPDYVSQQPCAPFSVTFELREDDTDALARLRDGTTDALPAAFADADLLEQQGATVTRFEDTVWSLLFDTRDEVLGDVRVRQALIGVLDLSSLEALLPDDLALADGYVMPAVNFSGESYRSLAGLDCTPRVEGDARALLTQALAELELDKLPKLSVLCPEGDVYPVLLSQLQKAWNEQLSSFINLEPVPLDELYRRVYAGEYDMALFPMTASYNSPGAVLGAFASGAADNYTGFADPQYDQLLAQASTEDSLSDSVSLYRQAEELLLEKLPAYPLFFQTSCYAQAKGVQGIEFSPFSYRVFFQHARKS